MNRRLLCVLFSAGLTCSAIGEESLIVTSSGDGIWGTTVSRSGGVVTYTRKDTGGQNTISSDKVHGVVPKVIRGKKYSDDEIQKNINLITSLKRRHKSLYRQLQTLQQGWQSLQQPTSDLEARINKLKQEFEVGDKSTKSYKDAVLGLGMVQFKDMGGKYTDKIKQYTEDIKTDYIETNRERLKQQAAFAETMSYSSFVEFEQLTKNIVKELDEAGRSELKASLETTRQKVIDGQCREAYNAFVSKRSIDGYLDAAAIMLGTRENVAETEAQKSAIDKRMESLVSMTKQVAKGYYIDSKGYPLSPGLRNIISAAGNACSIGTSGDEELNEQIFITPKARPAGLKFGHPFSVPMILVTQRAQPNNRKFAFQVIYPGAGKFTRELDSINFKSGAAELVFSENFADIRGAQLQPTEDGRLYFYFYLSYKDVDGQWKPISKTCFWEISQ